MSKKISNYFYQRGNSLICLKDCTISIDLSYYSMDDTILITDELVWVKSLVSEVEFDDIMFNLILDYSVVFRIDNIIKHGKDSIDLKYKKDAIILDIPLEAIEMKQQAAYIERLIGGREIVKSPEHLFRKLYDVYGPISNLDIVHLEVLLSQCLRDKSNPAIAARLGKTWDPIMVNIKKNIFNTGFLQGLGFENVNQVIKTGLISEEEAEPSIIEKIMTGTLVEKKEDKY